MNSQDSFFQEGSEPVRFDLGKCPHCGNHELFYTTEGNAFMWSRRNCCLPNALRRASTAIKTLQDEPDHPDYDLVREDVRELMVEIQALLAAEPDKKAALKGAQEKVGKTPYNNIDVVGRIMRQMGSR